MDQIFEQWMDQVNACLERQIQLCSMDLPDICYRDMFDAGEAPEAAAQEAIDNA